VQESKRYTKVLSDLQTNEKNAARVCPRALAHHDPSAPLIDMMLGLGLGSFYIRYTTKERGVTLIKNVHDLTPLALYQLTQNELCNARIGR
jgi:hypothetical protein